MITPETLPVSDNTALSYQNYILHATYISRAGYGNALLPELQYVVVPHWSGFPA
jgi:hypothetical protein